MMQLSQVNDVVTELIASTRMVRYSSTIDANCRAPDNMMPLYVKHIDY